MVSLHFVSEELRGPLSGRTELIQRDQQGARLRNPGLAKNQVDIWRIPLCLPDKQILDYRSVLSDDERHRADRFHFEKHRRRFTVVRGAMRGILGGYTHLAAQEVVFSHTAKGKPELSGDLQESGIKFNLSHSGETALLAVANGLALGIDIELIDPTFDIEEIATRFFTEHEAECLKAISAEGRAEAFFACWTRKEAYIKAVGEGLAMPLDCFEVAVGSEVKAGLLAVKMDPSEIERWSMYDIEVPEPYKAALVVEGRGHVLRSLDVCKNQNLVSGGSSPDQ